VKIGVKFFDCFQHFGGIRLLSITYCLIFLTPIVSLAELPWWEIARENEIKRLKTYRGKPPSVIETSLGQQQVLSKDLILLPEHAEIPTAILHNMDSRSLGKALVQRLHIREELRQKWKETVAFNAAEGASVVMQVHADQLQAIIKNGFLNYHQTGHTSGNPKQEFRSEVEDEIARLGLGGGTWPTDDGETIPQNEKDQSSFNLLRPKYAHLLLHNQPWFTRRGFNSQYGNIFIVFKDDVKLRTTWTLGDTLEHLTPNEKDGFTRTLLSNTLARPDVNKLGRYLEAQIWGELNLSDVQAVYVENQNIPELSLFKTTDIPVYLVKKVTKKRVQEFEIVHQIYSGKINQCHLLYK
jgi:hypothetical protein